MEKKGQNFNRLKSLCSLCLCGEFQFAVEF